MATRHLCALLDPAADLVLVEPDDPPRLPVVEEGWPSLADLRLAVGAPTAWPAAPPFVADGAYVGAVVDVLLARAQDHTDGRRWWPLAHADRLGLGPGGATALVTAARELRDGAPDDGRAAWWRPGWADEVDAWVDEVLEARGERRLGPGDPAKVWSLSAVVRYVVADATGRERTVWFKQPCDGFAAEPAITAWVCTVAPHLAPGLVAHDSSRAWLLVEHVEEAEDEVDPVLLADVARVHAHAQLATVGMLDGLLAAGAPERGAVATVAGLQRVLPASKALPWVVDQVHELHASGLPLTLVHGDLHSWNVGRRLAGSPLVFDWTDACVAHPYLDGRHLATSAERSVGPEAGAMVRDAFLSVWAAAYPQVDHARLWDLAHVADRAFTLLSYDAIGRALRPQDRHEHAGVVGQLVGDLEVLAGVAPPPA